jgi:hypothetical protein
MVCNNDVQGTDGIQVERFRVAFVTGNTLTVDHKAIASDVIGYIRVEAFATAIVSDNHFEASDNQGPHTDKTVIYAKSIDGVVSGNSVKANLVAGIVDTAIVVDGAFKVSDNTYLGPLEHIGSSGVPLDNGIVVRGADSSIGYNDMNVDVSAATGETFLESKEIMFTNKGNLAVSVGGMRLPFRQDAEIISVSAFVSTAPTGASIVVDIHKNGTTIFSSGKPTILATEFSSGKVVPSSAGLLADDYVTMDIDQIGSTIPGSDLVVAVSWRPA